MQRFMDRLTGFLERRRRLVLAVWVVLLIASLPFAMKQTEHLTSGGFSIPGSGSESVDRALADFEHAERQTLSVVVARRPGGDAADVRRELARVDAIVDDVELAELTPRALAAANRDAERSPIAIATLKTQGTMDDTADLAVDLRKELGIGAGPSNGTETYLVGEQALWAGMQDLSKKDLERAEVAGFPIVLLILLAVFGSLVAALMPLLLGFVSVMVTGGGIYFLSQATDMSVFVTNVASMIGIGVAVDYSLFILSRYREEIAAGADPVEARRIAMRTSGVAVALLRHHGDRVARRAAAGRLDHAALDGLRGDHGRRCLGHRRDDLPAGADGGVGPARLRARPDRRRRRRDRARPAPPVPPQAASRRRAGLLAELDRPRHAPSRADRTRRVLGDVGARDPGAVAGDRGRRAAPVPGRQRDARRRRARGEEGRRGGVGAGRGARHLRDRQGDRSRQPARAEAVRRRGGQGPRRRRRSLRRLRRATGPRR